ncbi:hypothetical protein GU700_21620 [Methylobacterium sp. NI91]|nr:MULTISPECIES: hypothetical protein [unclassified Methylobacterium]QIJ76948.1 hypothetical protein CLZ_21615 [Methylobacterium sp. CLZ]QIJ81852.1 hypothetical protein GU700_21620 [Methylobacterium sp. NI91]
MNDTITTPAVHIQPKPTEPAFDGVYYDFSEMDCLAAYLGQEPGTSVSLEDIAGLLHKDEMGRAIAEGRSELIERNLTRMCFTEYGDKIAHRIMREIRADWSHMANEITAEFIVSAYVMGDLDTYVREASDRAKKKRRAALDAETASTGRPLTVERAREFVARELELTMRETIRRTTGLKAEQVLALAA